MSVYPCAAGPSTLPEAFLSQTQAGFPRRRHGDSGPVALAHWDTYFQPVPKKAPVKVRRLRNLSDDDSLRAIAGGAGMPFAIRHGAASGKEGFPR